MTDVAALGDVDAVVEAYLAAVTPAQWERLARAHDALLGPGPWGRWAGGERRPDGAIQMPYPVEGPELAEARAAVADADLIVGYAWPDWADGVAILQDPERLANVGAVDAVKLWVRIVRLERFVDGSVLGAAERGELQQVLAGILRYRG